MGLKKERVVLVNKRIVSSLFRAPRQNSINAKALCAKRAQTAHGSHRHTTKHNAGNQYYLLRAEMLVPH
jgi:hypothetical protein